MKKILFFILCVLFISGIYDYNWILGIGTSLLLIILSIITIYIGHKANEAEKKEQLMQEHQEELARMQEQMAREKEEKIFQTALNNAKYEYEESLKGTNKGVALKKGREYYSLYRNGIAALSEDFTNDLSRRDEERIRLDIQAMNC